MVNLHAKAFHAHLQFHLREHIFKVNVDTELGDIAIINTTTASQTLPIFLNYKQDF
jgi:hypothetical protein